jgi:hypothetical protein
MTAPLRPAAYRPGRGGRQTLEGKDHEWILANLAGIREGITRMMSQARERQGLLK